MFPWQCSEATHGDQRDALWEFFSGVSDAPWPEEEAPTDCAFGFSDSQSSAGEQSRSPPGKAEGLCVHGVRAHGVPVTLDALWLVMMTKETPLQQEGTWASRGGGISICHRPQTLKRKRIFSLETRRGQGQRFGEGSQCQCGQNKETSDPGELSGA